MGNNEKLRLFGRRTGAPLSSAFCSLFAFSSIFFSCILFSGEKKNHTTQMDNSSQESRRDCLRQIAQMRRTRGSESDWYALLGEAARSLSVRPAAPPLPNLSDLVLFWGFFGRAVEYAVFPYKLKRPVALGSDFGARDKAWKWTFGQITESALRQIGFIDILFTS